MKRLLMVEKLSRLLSKLLDIGAKIVHTVWSTYNRAYPG
jgi:hypothetical protein